MYNKNSVVIKIDNESVIFQQNEFWYFSKMIKNIYEDYDTQLNHTKNILIKIPGSGKFKKVNFASIKKIMKQIKVIIDSYTDEASLQYI